MLCPSRSTWVRFATPTKDIGTDPDRFPLLFQSDYTLRHWPRRHLAYWRIISSFVPSQMALCCAQRGRCSAPDGHPPDSGSGRTTSPVGSGLLCLTLRRLGQALMQRIQGSYRFIVGFNLTLIALGVAGVLPPTTSALLHNGSTLGISLQNMTDLLDDEENPRK